MNFAERVAKKIVSGKNNFSPNRRGAATPGEKQVISEMKRSRQRSASIQQVMPKPKREPLSVLIDAGINLLDPDEDQRIALREWARSYYAGHNLVPLCIDIYSRFPVQGAEVVCKDPQLQKFYQELFFKELNYEELLVEMGKEFWIAGEVTTLGNFNEALGVWDQEEILNPDDIEVTKSAFDPEPVLKISIPEHLKKIIKEQSPRYEYDILVEEYPEIVDSIRAGDKVSVSPLLVSRIVNKLSPWDLYGTPHLVRGYTQLMLEESLMSAQNAVADRLYAPFILAQLGMQNLGDNQGPWIPDEEELDATRDTINDALAADFKLLVHHFGLDIKSVFGREAMPRLDSDFERVERKILQIWGIGESLISGSSNGAYASSALNRELVTQLMSTYQNQLKKHFEKRASLVAEAQEHFDYEISDGKRIPIYEEVYEIDEKTGQETITKRPKLLIPEIKFKVLNLRDEAQERTFLQTLKSSGVPISDRTLSVNLPFDADEELELIAQEKVAKIVAEAEVKKRVIEVLTAKGLPIPDELKDKPEAPAVPSPGVEGETPEGIPGTQEEAEEQSDSGGAIPDVTSPAPTPNVSPSDGDSPTEESGNAPSSRNQIKQRPEVSDEMGKSSRLTPRLRRFDPKYTSVQGLRGKLSEESVQSAVNERKWEGTRPGIAKS